MINNQAQDFVLKLSYNGAEFQKKTFLQSRNKLYHPTLSAHQKLPLKTPRS